MKKIMKKIFSIFLSVTSFLCFSQSRDKGTIELSPVIGYSQSMIFIFTSEPVGGINIGSNVDYYFNENWSLRSGLFYQTMGSNEVNFLIFSDKYSEKLKYLSVPLVINWHFGSNKNWNLNYGVGGGCLGGGCSIGHHSGCGNSACSGGGASGCSGGASGCSGGASGCSGGSGCGGGCGGGGCGGGGCG
jgi:hypothetical protein